MLLISNFLLVAGAAVLFTLLGIFIHRYRIRTQRDEAVNGYFKASVFNYGVMVGIGLLLLGILSGFLQLPSQQLIVVRIDNPEAAENLPFMSAQQNFTPADLIMDLLNKSHRLNSRGAKDPQMKLFWDGNVRTAFFRYDVGTYTVSFNARGSKADNVFSRIKIEYESPDHNNFLVVRANRYIELSNKMHDYAMVFHTTGPSFGRVRISFFNDVYLPESREGRDVFIENVSISKEN